MPIGLVLTAIRAGIALVSETKKSISHSIESTRLSTMTPAQKEAHFEKKHRQEILGQEIERIERREVHRELGITFFRFFAAIAVVAGVFWLAYLIQGC